MERMVKRYANGEENTNIVTDQLANMYHCPDCGFEYNAQHTQDDKEGGYVCPLCETIELEEKVKKYENALKLADRRLISMCGKADNPRRR
jgi:rubrerythrin